MNTYKLKVGNLERELPIMKIKDDLAIASFVILGDTELITDAAPLIADKLKNIDVIVTAEAKGIPIAYEVSKQLKMKSYVVARKSIKPYMKDPIVEEVFSITTQKKQVLCLDKKDGDSIKGKRVAIIDDVISTGESLKTIENLVKKAGGIVAAKAAILAEGDAAKREDIIYIDKLPLFKVNCDGSISILND